MCESAYTLSVTQYLFTLCWVRWRGMVAPSVYRAGHVCSKVSSVAALCSNWLESAEPLRNVTSSSRKKVGRSYSWRGYYLQVCAACAAVLFASVCCLWNCIICKCVLPAQMYYLQVYAACATVLFASVCCLSNCIIFKCVRPAQQHYLEVCAACPTVLFASVCCLPKCIICMSVLPAQLYYLHVCAACPTVLFASVCCLCNCIICKCVLPV
jgi:hypothetical protein